MKKAEPNKPGLVKIVYSQLVTKPQTSHFCSFSHGILGKSPGSMSRMLRSP
jgi:hypothetical protein